MIENYMISFLRLFFMNSSILYAFIKIKNCCRIDKKKILFLLLSNILISIIFTLVYEQMNNNMIKMVTILICYISNILISAILLRKFDNRFFIIMMMSICISISLFILSGFIVFNITNLPLFNSIKQSMLEYLLIGLIQITLTFCFFKIKRFKNGFSFVNEEKFSRYVNLLNVILVTIVISYILFITYKQKIINDTISFICIISGMILIIYLIKRFITKHYKLKMKDRTVELLNEQIDEKDKEIIELKEELAKVHKINHKYNHRISAMEKAVSKLKFNEEFSKENGDIIELVENLSKEYKEELNTLDDKEPQVKTGITGVDNILEYMCQEAQKNNIEIKIETNCDLKDIINILPESKLETMLADHINDAIIAINFSKNSNRKILITFNKTDNIYQIKIYDTGIEFEIDTLLKLGLEQTTTHKETGRKRSRIYYNIWNFKRN